MLQSIVATGYQSQQTSRSDPVRITAPRRWLAAWFGPLPAWKGAAHVLRPHPRLADRPYPGRIELAALAASTARTSSSAASGARTGWRLARTPPTSSRWSATSISSSSGTSQDFALVAPRRVPRPARPPLRRPAFRGHGDVLTWVHRRRPHAFPFLRTTLIVSTALALADTSCIPQRRRASPACGFADTVTTHTGLNLSSDLLGSLYNPIAAVPSLHFGYSLIVGVALAQLASNRWLRIVGAAYPARCF